MRDRLLFAVLLDTGVRIGEALGLRHEDIEIAERRSRSCRGPTTTGPEPRRAGRGSIPASAELMRLYADYLNREYGALDSDYVFVNLWGRPRGHPLTYPAVYDLVGRLRRRTGVVFGPHHFRHTYATWLLRRGAGMESVKSCSGTPRSPPRSTPTAISPSRTPARPCRPRAGSPAGRSGCDRRAGPRRAGERGGGLLEKLMAAVRPEFRVEVYFPTRIDPVLGRRLRGARL